jgi:predicted RNA-binding protein
MCLANIYQRGNGGKLLMKDIAYLKVDGDQIKVENLTGEGKVLQGRIKEIDFMSSDIVIEEATHEEGRE